MNNSQISSINL